MKSMTFVRNPLWVLLLPLFLFSCEDKMDEHYEKPAWLKGSAWEVLSDNEYDGKYSIFLEAADLAGFRPILEGKGIATVMAPDNDAFTSYLEEKGYVSVRDIPTAELKKLIGFHLVYYSYNKSDLENFRPEADTSDDDKDDDTEVVLPGMYYKFRTRSSSPTTQVTGLNSSGEVTTLTIYHLERFLPVFSHYMFSSKKIDAKKNYEYFYPGSTWNGDNGFNISNASVKEYQVIANNGYIYTIDKVLEPLETIYDEMKQNSEYSNFVNFYDSFSTYTLDEDLVEDYGDALGVDELYLHTHLSNGLPNIALEWPVSNYRLIPQLASVAYSVFAPSNTALINFFDKFWKGKGYDTLADLDPLVIKLLILQYVYGGSIVFPDEVQTITNAYGTSYNFDPYSVKDKSICVNGSFYGLDEIETPPIFNSVIGPAFSHQEYLNFLYTLYGNGDDNLLRTYSSQATKYTVLMPANDNYEKNNMFLDVVGGTKVLAREGDEGNEAVPTSELQRLVNVHTVSGEVELPKNGTKVYTSQNASTYWFVKDGKITTNAIFNNALGLTTQNFSDLFVEVDEVTNDGKAWSNGRTYVYGANNYGVFDTEQSKGMKAALATCAESRYPYFVFAQLLKKANMISGESMPAYPGRVVAFIPTNEALVAAMENNEIPGVTDGQVDLSQAEPTLNGTFDAEILKEYLMEYFMITSYAPEVSSCPYIGSTTWKTGTYRNSVTHKLNYTDTGSSISVQLGEGNVCHVVPTYYYFPFAFNDGGFHLIDSVFK